jgi:hypothetical protein
MFDIEVFKQYLLENADTTRVTKIALVDLINSIVDLSKSPDKHLNVRSSTSSYYIKRVFYKILENKPRSVPVQKYLLHQIGFQKCYKCSEVLSLDSFNKISGKWNMLDSECRSCANSRSRNYRINNIDKELARDKAYKEKNKEQLALNRINRYRKNPEAEIAKVREWQKLNPDKVNASQAKRRANQLKATPSWLTDSQWLEIKNFYALAKKLEKETGIKYHVDHIIPLKGKNICGLHVPWNLQLLTAEQNLVKSNKFCDSSGCVI